MKKLLLGWLAVGCLATGAFASDCSVGDVVDTWATDTDLADSFGTTDAKSTKSAILRTNEAAVGGTQQGSTETVRAVIAQVKPGSGFSMGGVSVSSINAGSSMEAYAAVATHGYNCGWELWATPFASWAQLDKSGNSAGYDHDTYGLNIGVTKRFDKFYVGALAGFARGEFDADGAYAKHESDNWTVGLYGGLNIGKLFVNSTVGYVWSEYDDEKFNIVYGANNAANPYLWRAKGKNHDGRSWFADIKVGYDFELGGCWTVTPSVGFEYINSKSKSYKANAVNLTDNTIANQVIRFNESKATSARIPVMIKVARQIKSVNVFAEGGYIRELHDSASTGSFIVPNGGGSYAWAMKGRKPEKDFGKVGAGLTGMVGRWNYGLRGDYEWSSDFDAFTLTGKIGVTF